MNAIRANTFGLLDDTPLLFRHPQAIMKNCRATFNLCRRHNPPPHHRFHQATLPVQTWDTRQGSYLFNIQDTHGVGEAGSLLPSSHHHNRVPGLHKATFLAKGYCIVNTGIDVLHPVFHSVSCKNTNGKSLIQSPPNMKYSIIWIIDTNYFFMSTL